MVDGPSDDYKHAFDHFEKLEDGSDTTSVPMPDTPPASETPPAAETPPADTPPASETPPAAETPPADTPPAPEAAPATDDILNRLAKLVSDKPVEAPAAEPAPREDPVYTQSELETLAKYEEDWPDVARAELLRRRVEYRDLVKLVYDNVAKYVEPLFALGDQLAARAHESDLSAAVPDYKQLDYGQVMSWIDTQPAFLQGPMKQVMQSGTAEELKYLIGSYRQASQPPAPTLIPTPTAPKAELSDDTKQAVKSLAPVSSDRTVVPAEQAADYKSSFDKWAAEMDVKS